jgi:hypothetical protein
MPLRDRGYMKREPGDPRPTAIFPPWRDCRAPLKIWTGLIRQEG